MIYRNFFIISVYFVNMSNFFHFFDISKKYVEQFITFYKNEDKNAKS